MLLEGQRLDVELEVENSGHGAMVFTGALHTYLRTREVEHAQLEGLSGTEYRLLRVFLDHPNRVLSRDQLLELTQGRDAGPFDRAVDVQVSRLRQRLGDDPHEPKLIKTVRGEGYVLAASVEPLPE